VPSRGEVWLVDLGIVQKARPALPRPTFNRSLGLTSCGGNMTFSRTPFRGGVSPSRLSAQDAPHLSTSIFLLPDLKRGTFWGTSTRASSCWIAWGGCCGSGAGSGTCDPATSNSCQQVPQISFGRLKDASTVTFVWQ
jgi:hypothetical protein